ncbi:uncharacterized protein EI97DRAFT_458434 [Westerdykella ornata]|uniref:Uncharacterized protein n=1 Tax=Westerdykella ornata TaxID=318751 RepID=A0A6A6JNL0_WESOR|nr:uncharacterized protein EI97DRAFT_458434 [Westerdykella ornata]KAF2276509.1 hypothetical protein EI97DRAFT_458434 [Westerdykella ornata]
MAGPAAGTCRDLGPILKSIYFHTLVVATLGFFNTVISLLTPFALSPGYNLTRSASSPLRSNSDTTSPMYPDRPIRPLPSRPLRSRLSPEQAKSIVYPPAPPSSTALFNFPYSPVESRASPRVEVRRGDSDHHACHCGQDHSDGESGDENYDEYKVDERGRPVPTSPSDPYSRRQGGKATGTGYPKPASTTSSADGYESFENTNNKKKRKIPNMGGTSAHHSSLSAEMASMGISGHDGATSDDTDGPGRYYASAPSTPQNNGSGTGISGAGRGRFGRSGSGRSERRVLGQTNSANLNLAHVKANSNKRPQDNSGIISTAIANAQATPPSQSNENVSLLHQEASKPTANKTQFTFTCGSDSASQMVWPGHQNGADPQPPGAYPSDRHGPPPRRPAHPTAATRTTPTAGYDRPPQGAPATGPPNGASHPQAGKAPPPNNGGAHATTGQQPPPAPPPPKPRRSASKLYAYAARKRRLAQQYANFHNPPAQPWICQFCEYEAIFGVPPVALIRKYEMKDRKERKRLAEKRRLLEKARMKGRKGKKGNKKGQNNANNAQHNQNVPPGSYDRHPDDASLDPGDEYYDDDYDDNFPPPHPTMGPGCFDQAGCVHHHDGSPAALPGDPRGGGRSAAVGA